MDDLGLISQLKTATNTFWDDPAWRKVPRSARQMGHLKEIHKAQTDRAIARYEMALGGRGWLTTAKVEQLLGQAASECNAFLRKLRKMGFIESRPRDGAEKYIRNRGWEWKWKETSMDKDLKEWIDNATYGEMLLRWNTDPKDSPIYNPQYAACVYFNKQMKAKMQALTPEQIRSVNNIVQDQIRLTRGVRGGTIQSGQPRDSK